MRRFLAISLVFLLSTSPAPAQFLGITGSYAISLLERGRMTEGWRSWCLCEEDGSALVQHALFTATFLQHLPASPYSVVARTGVGTARELFLSPTYASDEAGLPAGARLQYNETRTLVTFRFDLEGRVRTGGEGGLTFGPWLEYALQSRLDRTERLLAPDDALFPGTGSPERGVSDRPPSPASRLRWGLSGGVSLVVEVSPALTLMPQIALQADLDALGNARPEALLFNAGSGVLFDIRGLAARPAPIAPPVDPSPDDRSSLPSTRVAVDLYAIENGAPVQSARVRRVTGYRRAVVQLERAVTFEPGTMRIANMDLRADGEPFDEGALVGMEPAAIARRELDIIGLRMRSDARSRLELAGTYVPSEGPDDARARVDVVREYLQSRWGIARPRLDASKSAAVGARPEVRLSSGSRTLFAPHVVEWLTERFVLPPIAVDPTIEAPRGVRASRLRLMREGAVISEAELDEGARIPEIAIDIENAMASGTIAPITVEIEVTDSSGAATRAVDALPLELPPADPDAAPERSHITLRYRDGAPPDEAILAELRRSLGDAARIRITLPSATQTPGNTTTSVVRELLRGYDVKERQGSDGWVLVDIER